VISPPSWISAVEFAVQSKAKARLDILLLTYIARLSTSILS
jgi:hypothetical protein